MKKNKVHGYTYDLPKEKIVMDDEPKEVIYSSEAEIKKKSRANKTFNKQMLIEKIATAEIDYEIKLTQDFLDYIQKISDGDQKLAEKIRKRYISIISVNGAVFDVYGTLDQIKEVVLVNSPIEEKRNGRT
jgi:hypothetical protein